MNRNHNRSLLAFLLLVFSLSTVIILIAKLSGKTQNLVAGIYMLVPALSAVIIRLTVYDKKFSDSGLRFGPWKNYLVAWASGLALSISYGVGFYLTGCVDLDFSGDGFLKQIESIAPGMGNDMMEQLPEGFSLQLMLLLYTIGGLTLFNIPGIIIGFGEEFGWRGFMFPLFYQISPRLAFIGGGLIWFIWHIPLGFLGPETETEVTTKAVLNYLLLGVSSLGMYAIFAYIFVVTKSIWVPSFFHIVVNNSQRAFSYWYSVKDQELASIILSLITIVVVLALWKSGRFRVFERWGNEIKES